MNRCAFFTLALWAQACLTTQDVGARDPDAAGTDVARAPDAPPATVDDVAAPDAAAPDAPRVAPDAADATAGDGPATDVDVVAPAVHFAYVELHSAVNPLHPSTVAIVRLRATPSAPPVALPAPLETRGACSAYANPSSAPLEATAGVDIGPGAVAVAAGGRRADSVAFDTRSGAYVAQFEPQLPPGTDVSFEIRANAGAPPLSVTLRVDDVTLATPMVTPGEANLIVRYTPGADLVVRANPPALPGGTLALSLYGVASMSPPTPSRQIRCDLPFDASAVTVPWDFARRYVPAVTPATDLDGSAMLLVHTVGPTTSEQAGVHVEASSLGLLGGTLTAVGR